LLRNRTWDARRATVGPYVAAISGLRRSLRVSSAGVCSTASTGRGILPSWSCEFDSRHPLHNKTPSQGNIGTSSKHCGDSTPEISSWSRGSMFLPDLDDKPPCHTHFSIARSTAPRIPKPRFRAIIGQLRFRRPGKYLGGGPPEAVPYTAAKEADPRRVRGRRPPSHGSDTPHGSGSTSPGGSSQAPLAAGLRTTRLDGPVMHANG
jgi:hypothetical protein